MISWTPFATAPNDTLPAPLRLASVSISFGSVTATVPMTTLCPTSTGAVSVTAVTAGAGSTTNEPDCTRDVPTPASDTE